MQFRDSLISNPNNKSVRINKNESEKTMVRGEYNSAKKPPPIMDFSYAKSEKDSEYQV